MDYLIPRRSHFYFGVDGMYMEFALCSPDDPDDNCGLLRWFDVHLGNADAHYVFDDPWKHYDAEIGKGIASMWAGGVN